MADEQDIAPPPRGRARGRIRATTSARAGPSSLFGDLGAGSGRASGLAVSDVETVSDATETLSLGGSATSFGSSSASTIARRDTSIDSLSNLPAGTSSRPSDVETESVRSSNSDSKKGLRITRKESFDKIGQGGEKFHVMTNYLHVNKTPNFQLMQYRVDFTPEEDSTLLKKLLVRSQESVIGPYIFDGHMLYTTTIIPMEKRRLEAVGQGGDDQEVTFVINIKTVGYVLPDSAMYIQFYNMVMRKAMGLIGMEELGRHFYDRNQCISYPDHHLELWPGIITAIRNHDAGMLLCLEVTHKVLRMASVMDTLNNIKRATSSQDEYHKRAREELIGVIVITHYNRRTYRIDDIDFNVTPGSTFRLQDGTTSTYSEYYMKRYNVDLIDKSQPMLVSYPKKKDLNKGITGNIYLAPALCNPTGLTDEMRKNFQLMQQLSAHLAMAPSRRKDMLDKFISKLKTTPSVQEEFSKWNIDFVPDFVAAEARKYQTEDIYMGPEGSQPVHGDSKADWTRALKMRGMLVPKQFLNWVLFVPKNCSTYVDNLIQNLKMAGRGIAVNVTEPLKIVEYRSAVGLTGDIDTELRKLGSQVEFVFIVLSSNNLRTYTEVKRKCLLDFGYGCQCMLAKHINKTDAKAKQKLGSVCTKIMVQINCKLGGIPWGVKIPVKKIMIMGFDVYHCSERKGESVGALVSTRDQTLNEYFSVVAFHKEKSELALNLTSSIQKSLHAYRINNNEALPDRIVLYRDGVGEGQINYLLDYEIPRLKQGIREYYDKLGVPPAKLSVIVVTKKINSRVLLAKAGVPVSYDNVPPGTVVDNTISLPERYDFFLVAQSVNQGTVSPTNYNVVHDEIEWSADKMQRLSFKLCHLYYNWSGTVAVPAPCQYAHKLAYLTGVSLNAEAPLDLATNLWYL